MDAANVTMATPPSTPEAQASKSRFFGPQKKRPWEESVEQIEILSARPNNDDDDVVASVINDCVVHTEQNEENNSKTQLLNEGKVAKDGGAVNPFAKFAFGDGAPKASSPRAKKKWATVQSRKKQCVSKKNTRPTKDWIRMKDCSKEEQERIVAKWHSLADANAPLETRRFQVMVAARLHARCQEPVVRKCMDALRSKYTPLDAASLSKANPDTLAETISSLQFFNVKAQHLVAAANQVQTRFNGKVPEKESELKSITGIGPVMADLLAFVNTVDAHNKNAGETTGLKHRADETS